MSTKHYKIVWEDELVYNDPPFQYLRWDQVAIRRLLQQRGFDLNRTIAKVLDWRGWCWVQRK